MDELLIDIGLGNIMSVLIAQRFLGDNTSNLHSSNLPIIGAEGLLVTFAKCCCPIPGDHIVAHVSQGKGLVVHMESCTNIRGYETDPSRYIPVQWQPENDEHHEYPTRLRVELINHQGALARVTKTIADCNSNIHNLSTEEKEGRVYLIHLRILVKNRIHLAQIMKKIRLQSDILKISREKS